METITLQVDKRADSGKKVSAALRKAGRMPAVIYGMSASQKLTLDAKAFKKALSGPSGTHVILQLEMGDGKGLHNALLKELQFHPITDQFIHADLLEIDLNKPIRVKLPIVVSGESVGVKVSGGEIRIHARDLHVECMPSVMPRDIKVDISTLDINKIWHLSDLTLPEGIKATDAPEMAIVSCITPKKEEVVAAVVAEGAAPAEGAAAAGAAPAAAGKGAAPAAPGKGAAPAAAGKGAAPAKGGGKEGGKK